MKFVGKLKKSFLSFFICPKDENVDEDFQQILQHYYVAGFYQPKKTSIKRVCYGVIAFLFVAMCYVLGTVKTTFQAIVKGDIGKIIINAATISVAFSWQIQVISFIVNQKAIVEAIKNFHFMLNEDANEIKKSYRLKFSRLFKYYKIFLIISINSLIALKLAGYHCFTLVMPTLYDDLANIPGYYNFLLTLNSFQVYCYAMIYVANDLLEILCLMRVEANLEYLSLKLRASTDGKNLLENERRLIDCVKYHCRIIEEMKEIGKIFKVNFFSKVHVMFLNLTFIFYVLIQVDFREQPLSYLFAALALELTLFQFGAPSYFGQKLTTRSEELMNASYSCNWIEQTKNFKSILFTLRIVCQREIRIKAGKFEYSHECFNAIVTNSYGYCTTLGNTVKSRENHN